MAVTVVEPASNVVAKPPPLIFATDVFDELQATSTVITWIAPSEYVPEAENCSVSNDGTLGLIGVTDIDERTAELTVRIVFPEILPEVAVMVVEPAAVVVARPLALTVAMDAVDEFQET